jgi:hypothetical protein
LYRLKNVLGDTHIAVLVDMQAAARGTVDFFYSLADDIAYTLEDQGITVELPPRSDFADSPEFFFRSRFLRSIYEMLPICGDGPSRSTPSAASAASEPAVSASSADQPVGLPRPAAGKKHLLLMFDEFEELQKRVEDGKLDAEVFPFLRNLMQHEEPLDCLCGHASWKNSAQVLVDPVQHRLYKKITFLSHDDAQRLIVER